MRGKPIARDRQQGHGEGGIRTLGTLLGYGALAKRCFRPLSHLTNEVREYCRNRLLPIDLARLNSPGKNSGQLRSISAVVRKQRD